MYKDKEALEKLIKNGYNCKQIANKFNVSTSTIRKYTNKYELKFKNRYLSEETKKNIINAAKEGMTHKEICAKYPISPNYISEFLNNNNIRGTVRKKKYRNIDFDYFETIDTEHKAYWLGFLMADGCVSKTSPRNKRPNRLQINISNKDVCLLEQFCKDINMDIENIKVYTPKGTYSTNKMCKLYINSQKLCNDLNKYGIVPNKTGKEIVPTNIPEELLRHFVRGFFDGDGCTLMDRKHDKLHGIEFCSNESFLITLQEIFINKKILNKEHLKTIYREKRHNQKLCYLAYTRKYIIENIFNYMYKDATIYLERKYNNFNK